MVLHCDELVPGGHLSTVVFDTGRREGALRWCRDLMFNREVLVSFHGELPVKFTLHQALVQAVEPQIVLHIPDDSHIFKVGIDTCSFGKGVIELCAGTGSMGIGPVFLGAHVVASLDKTPLAAHHLELNHHGHVMCADLCDPNNIWQLHQLIKDEQVTILLGFPCQPYSSQGRMQGHRDARASTLQHAIKAVGLLQPQAVLMECVCGASSDLEVRSAIRWICDFLEWQCKEVTLDLADQWPMRRRRWWCLLVPTAWANFELHPWAAIRPTPVIRNLFTRWGAWSQADEEALGLSLQEIAHYGNPQFGHDQRLLHADCKCATALHSYSVPLMPCPCGCRTAAFSTHSLRTKGLRGFYVTSEVTLQPRYLHPCELALLLGVPPLMRFVQDPRAALCMLGLVSSPMQSLWVFSHLIMGASNKVTHLGKIHPEQALVKYQNMLLQQAKQVTNVGQAEPLMLHILSEGVPSTISTRADTTIAQMIKAERISLEWGQTTSCQVDHRRVLPHEQILGRDGAICIERTYKKRRVEPPVEKLILAIVHEGELHLCFHQAGDFAFVALRELGFNTINWLLTVDGTIIAADTRLWHCGRFFTIGSGSFPIVQSLPGLMAGWGNVAGGALGDSGGLSGHCVFMEASRLLRQCEGAGDFVLLSPFYLDADFLMGQFTREMQDALGSFNGMAVFFLAVEGHWVLVVAQPTASCWRWWLFDGLHFNCREFVDDLIRSFMASWGGGQVPHQLHLVQRYAQMDQTSCGTIALAHLAFCLQVTNELTPEDILHWHFTLLAGDFGGQPRATGPHGRDLPAMLADILITKGVHPESALHRARDAIDTLGGKNIQSALAAKNPWQALKAEATKPGKNFKFITPGELDAHIEAQAKSRYGVDPRSKKQKQRTSSTVAKTPLKIDPRQIKLIQGHFRDPEGHPLDQLAIDQVGADSAGVAICSSLEAAPYIAEGKHISTSPLGLLVLDDLHQAELGYAEAQTIRFAGQYIATGEPVLLNARLIQLGDSAVVRAIGKDPMAGVGVAPTAVIKVSVYKDEFGSSWSVFCEAPIRGILQLVPPLNLCKKVGCGTTCRSFHPPVDEDTTSLVHEVWGRRFSLLTGSSCEAAKSENFHAFLRVTKSAMPELVSVNVMGIYLEPRADSSKGASEDFAVIWLPEASLEDAQHKLRTTAGALSIARLKTRYGLRVPAAKEKDIHNVLKPGTEYVKVAVQFVYRAHPLPFGIQRVAVQRMIKEWQWDARALQPAKGTSLGCAWDIGAACAPPSNVMTAFGQDVLLTCVRDKQAAASEPLLVASKRTQLHIRQVEASSSSIGPSKADPWLQPQFDPWGKATPPVVAAPVQQRIDEVEAQLRGNVQRMIQDEIGQVHDTTPPPGLWATYQDSNEQRFQKLEAGMKELQVHGQQMQSWLHEAGERLGGTEQRLQGLTQAMESQQQDIQMVRSELRSSVESVNSNMQGAVNCMRRDIGADLDGKLESIAVRFEAMLAKKQRTDA